MFLLAIINIKLFFNHVQDTILGSEDTQTNKTWSRLLVLYRLVGEMGKK